MRKRVSHLLGRVDPIPLPLFSFRALFLCLFFCTLYTAAPRPPRAVVVQLPRRRFLLGVHGGRVGQAPDVLPDVARGSDARDEPASVSRAGFRRSIRPQVSKMRTTPTFTCKTCRQQSQCCTFHGVFRGRDTTRREAIDVASKLESGRGLRKTKSSG